MRAHRSRTLALPCLAVCLLTPVATWAAPTSTCCIPDHGTGCDDPVIESCVCGFDPFCCDTQWDQICVNEADQCAPGFCPMIGACCVDITTCVDSVEVSQCSGQGGAFQGASTLCESQDCNPFNEACCFSNGSCAVMDPNECNSNGGLSQGTGTDCAEAFCPVTIEACCLSGGGCVDIDPLVCISADAVPQGPGSNCLLTTCSTIEACCYPDSNCFNEPPSSCITNGGSPQGPGSDCLFVTCPLPTIACCVPFLGCLDLFSFDCFESGGYLYPEGSACSDPQVSCDDCNFNFIPDNVEIAAGSANDINTNSVPDECEQDLNENGIPDEWEISQGSATDLDTNGIPDLVDILSCRYDDMNYNGLPDAIEIAEGSAADANTNGIIDEAEQPAGEHSAIALLQRVNTGKLLADASGDPIKYRVTSNGLVVVDGMGCPIPDPNGRSFISWIRDDILAKKLADILIDTSGPMPVSRVKDAKIFVQSCHGGGMLDDIDNALGKVVCWVGGSASRSDEVAHADDDRTPNPMGRWVRPLMDAMSNGMPVLQSLKHASRDSTSGPILNTNGTRDLATYRQGQKGGGDGITLEDPTATSHHAVFIAGITDQIGIENEITKMCELLKEQWGDLNTTGTSVHLVYGAGTTNPCAGSGVPNENVSTATFKSVCDVLDDVAADLGPNEEFVLFLGDHGLGTEPPVNTSAFRFAQGGGPVLTQKFTLSFSTIHGMTRNPENAPFIRVLASGAYPEKTVRVSVNGKFAGYLSPAVLNDSGQNENQVLVAEGFFRIGSNTLTIDAAGAGIIILETEFFTGALAPVPVPGWGDANGDGEVDLADIPSFSACVSGPGGGYLVPACYDMDIDVDGDVDLRDSYLLQQVFTGGLE